MNLYLKFNRSQIDGANREKSAPQLKSGIFRRIEQANPQVAAQIVPPVETQQEPATVTNHKFFGRIGVFNYEKG